MTQDSKVTFISCTYICKLIYVLLESIVFVWCFFLDQEIIYQVRPILPTFSHIGATNQIKNGKWSFFLPLCSYGRSSIAWTLYSGAAAILTFTYGSELLYFRFCVIIWRDLCSLSLSISFFPLQLSLPCDNLYVCTILRPHGKNCMVGLSTKNPKI